MCQRPAGAVAALDGPDPLVPGLGVLAHRCVPGPVGDESTVAQQLLAPVDDLVRGIVAYSLWGSTPTMTCSMCGPAFARSDMDGEVGSPFLSHASSR